MSHIHESLGEVRVGDYGGAVELRVLFRKDGVAIDISGSTTEEINLYKPDGTNTVIVATYVTNGTDGLIKAVVPTGELTLVGDYYYDGLVSAVASFTHNSGPFLFTVKDPLPR